MLAFIPYADLVTLLQVGASTGSRLTGNVSVYMEPVFRWIQAQPFLVVLLGLQALDIVSGLIAAYVTKQISSTVSSSGMGRKSMVWLLVGVAAIIDQFTGDIPETKLVCMFYSATELLSILENAARAGLPLPPALKDALKKLEPLTGPEEKAPLHIGNAVIHEASFVHVGSDPAPVLLPNSHADRVEETTTTKTRVTEKH
jgi:toxin secretion/phage lysis holin